MKILVTGTAGFIGFHLVNALFKKNYKVIGIDNINAYYDPKLKLRRLKASGVDNRSLIYGKHYKSSITEKYAFIKLDLNDITALERLFKKEKFDAVCHLAAQAGVRYSMKNPFIYIESNIAGFINILECSKNFGVKNLCFASTSSVYGLNQKMPFSEKDNVDHPISLYAATKKSNELMAHVYSYLYGLKVTGLRFFTVYGPWGRPDMALFKFVKNIIEDKEIDVYNYGKMKRDFTYIDDIVEGVVRVIENPALPNKKWQANNPEPDSSVISYRIYNIGHGSSVPLMDFIHAIEEELGKKARLNMLPLQPGDVPETNASTESLQSDFDYKPRTEIKQGIKKFIDWYKEYYGVN